MLLGDFKDLPKSAQHLIIYYTIYMFDCLGFFVTIYLFALGFDIITVGALYSYLLLLTAFLRTIIGRLIDKYLPPKYLMIAVEALTAVFWVFLYFARTIRDFLLIFSISAVSSIFGVAYRSIERDVYPQDNLEVAYKHHMFWPYLVQFFSVPVYGFVLEFDFVKMFKALIWIATLFCVMRCLYIMLFIPKTKPAGRKDEKRSFIRDLLSLPRHLVLIIIAEILIFVGFDIAPFFVLENYLFNIMGITPFGISLVYSLGGLLGALGVFAYDRLRKIGSKRALYLALLLTSLSSLLMFASQYFENSFIFVLMVVGLMYISWVIWWTLHETIIMSMVPGETRGTVFGFLSATKIVIGIPLPLIAAWISNTNPLAPYLLQALVFLLTLPFYSLALKAPISSEKKVSE